MSILPMVQEVFDAIAVPLILAMAWQGLSILQTHGYRTTYAAAVLKAVGAGQQTATEQGLSIFSPQGRAVATASGARYLLNTVGDTGRALGIADLSEHAKRVDSQIGLMKATAAAMALPPAAAYAPPTVQ